MGLVGERAERRGRDTDGVVVDGRLGIFAAYVVNLVVVFCVAQVDFIWSDADDRSLTRSALRMRLREKISGNDSGPYSSCRRATCS